MRKKPSKQSANKLSFRLSPEYAEVVEKLAAEAGVNPNTFGRVATMAMAVSRFHDLVGKMGRIEDELIRLRKDFNDAVVGEVE